MEDLSETWEIGSVYFVLLLLFIFLLFLTTIRIRVGVFEKFNHVRRLNFNLFLTQIPTISF